jgi:PAS domain S-box-containing protein
VKKDTLLGSWMENVGPSRNYTNMEPEQSGQLEYILGCVSVGVAILDCADLRIRYANAHLLSLLEESWHPRGVIDHQLEEIMPSEAFKVAQPLLQEVCSSGRSASYTEIAFEGFLKTRGRTYWRVEIQPAPTVASMSGSKVQTQRRSNTREALLLTVEDQTNLVHSRLRLKAFHNVSSAIAGPYALSRVLDRILQAVQEMVGSTRCGVILIEQPDASSELRLPGLEEQSLSETRATVDSPTIVRVAAQRGLHAQSQDWHPELSQQLLVGRVMLTRQTMVITDTSRIPELEFPLLDDAGLPRRPGSVLSVPIFEPISDEKQDGNPTSNGTPPTGTVLGTIEVYHRRARGFPPEEVELLEQFAQQAGLAIQKARLFRDINRLAQVANRNARQRENIMQAIPDGVIIYDAQWHIADINHAARNMLGWSDEMIGMHVSEALVRSHAIFRYDPKNIPTIVARLEQRALEGSIDEVKIVGADGQPYTMRRSQAPIRDNRGDIFAYVVVYHDVTEQAIARERIEAEVIARTAELEQRNQALQIAKAAQEMERARLQLLLERLPSGVMLVSAADKRITLINNIGAHLLQRMGWVPEDTSPTSLGVFHRGTTPTLPGGQVSTINRGSTAAEDMEAISSQAVGINIETLLRTIAIYGPSGSIMPYEQQPLSLAFSKGEAKDAELHFTQADGQPMFLLVNAAPLRMSDGTISSAVTVWHDITQLKTLERAREDFFTTMAHELKTPLANIRAHVSALLANDLQWSVQEQHDFLEVADEQVERLVDMINHFLDASRVEAGALRLELEPILLTEMLEDLQDRLEGLITFSQRHLKIRTAPDSPAVMADYELIMSVLTNLLSNAFRYAPEGDTVILEAEPVYDKLDQQLPGVELRVIDHGPGITPEQQAQLFTRFSTFAAMRRPAADRPGQSAPGRRRGSIRWNPAATGLGLYISRGIIEAHGSTLTLKSSPGQGATFAFILPAANAIKREGG